MDDLTMAVLVWTICAALAFFVANAKRAPDAVTWGMWGLLLGPLGVIGALLIAKPGR